MTDYPTKLRFKHKGFDFVQVGIDLKTNMVTIKNLKTGKRGKIDYFKLQEILRKCN